MCRPPTMLANCPAASDGGLVDFLNPASGAGGKSRPPLHSQPVFRHVHHDAGDPAIARRFTRPSARDVDRLSSGVRWGGPVIPRPIVQGPISHCTSLVALPWPFCDILGVPPPAMSIVRRWRWHPGIGQERSQGPAGDRPPPFTPRQ